MSQSDSRQTLRVCVGLFAVLQLALVAFVFVLIRLTPKPVGSVRVRLVLAVSSAARTALHFTHPTHSQQSRICLCLASQPACLPAASKGRVQLANNGTDGPDDAAMRDALKPA